MSSEIRATKSGVEKIEKALCGDPLDQAEQPGLVARVHDLQRALDQSIEYGKRTAKTVFGNGVPGLAERVRDLESDTARRKRVETLILGASVPLVIGGLGTLLWELIKLVR
jgi:hypothetical protein